MSLLNPDVLQKPLWVDDAGPIATSFPIFEVLMAALAHRSAVSFDGFTVNDGQRRRERDHFKAVVSSFPGFRAHLDYVTPTARSKPRSSPVVDAGEAARSPAWMI
jgi:hypothetical protein